LHEQPLLCGFLARLHGPHGQGKSHDAARQRTELSPQAPVGSDASGIAG
jgi:hypothetical protein